MSYTPTQWKNGETPINADNLNKLEQGLSNTAKQTDELTAAVLELGTSVENLDTNVEALENTVNQQASDISDLYQSKATAVIQKVTTTGTVCVEDTTEGLIKLNELGGASEQYSTTGKNLTDCEDWETGSIDSSGAIVENDSCGRDTVYRPVSPNTTYTFSNNLAYMTRICEYDSEMNFIQRTENTATKITVTTTDTTAFIKCTFYAENVTVTTDVLASANLQLEEGVATEYEPYTGGQASPNPEYQQEIKPVTGKNLLDCRGLVEQTVKGVTSTPVYDANGNLEYVEVSCSNISNGVCVVLSNDIHLKAGEPVIISGCPIGGTTSTYRIMLREYVDGVQGDYIDGTHDIGDGKSYTPLTDITCRATIRINTGTTMENIRFYPMIRPASIADDTYVPYGCLRFWGHRKNFTNYEDWSNISIAEDGAETSKNSFGADMVYRKVKPNTAYVFSMNKGSIARIVQYDKDKKFISRVEGTAYVTNVAVVTSENTAYIRCTFYAGGSATVDSEYLATLDLQLEEGTEATPYEPYTEFSHTLSDPITLNGVGTAQDKIVRKDGVWKIEGKFAVAVFDGSDDENIVINTSKSNYFRITIAERLADAYSPVLCSHYKQIKYANVDSNNYGMVVSAQLNFKDKDCATLEEFKAKLQSSPITVLYELAEPTYEDLPTADQIALNSLVSYNGITYLYCDSEVQPTWDLECVLDTKRYIDRKFAELQALILES